MVSKLMIRTIGFVVNFIFFENVFPGSLTVNLYINTHHTCFAGYHGLASLQMYKICYLNSKHKRLLKDGNFVTDAA